MQKYDLGDPNSWPTVNGQQQKSQISGLPAPGDGWVIVLNNSPYGLDVQTGTDPFRVDAGIGRLLPVVGPDGYQIICVNIYAQPGANSGDLRRVTLEIYEPNEEIREHYPIELIRNTNVLNTVQTGSSVQQTQSVVYDQSAINGEAAGSVKSTAAAGSGAGKVDVTDANPSGGIWKRVMATGEMDVNPDGSVTAPAFHGTADKVPAGGVQPGTFGGATTDAWTFPGTVGVSNGKSFFDSGGLLHFPSTAGFGGATYFSGTGAGTFNHGFVGTPAFVGITSNQVNSTETVGIDSRTATTVHVNQGVGGWPWLGVAMG